MNFLRLVVMFLAIATAANGQGLAATELRGGGSWKTDGEQQRQAQQWSLDLRRADDGSVSGSVIVADSPLLHAGIIRGRIDGRVISGTITNDQGENVARFYGMVSRAGFRGKYVDRTGESGAWEWKGPLPN